MFDPGTPHSTRKARWPLVLAAVLAFTLTAGGMVAAIRQTDRADAADRTAATAPATMTAADHAAMATTTPADAPVDAPRNTHSAAVPAYTPGVQVID